MAGYIMNLNDEESIKKCIETGTYSTILKEPKNGKWNIAQEGTFADYFSMQEGDSIYFFHKRKIYGIGKIVNVNGECKYLNYKDADIPIIQSQDQYFNNYPLLEYGNVNNRCFCTFVPEPLFFMNGVDMDDVLSSNSEKFKIFRTMQQVSFIKVDDEENKALRDIILKRNEEYISTGKNCFEFNPQFHINIENNMRWFHRMEAYNILLSASNDKKIKHEMAIEASLCEQLCKENDTPFGRWDYISHQVAASPFKPIHYMDKMDVFGYKYIEGFDTISKYLVIEIKKDEAGAEVIEQIMKYVDWINREYSHGDYSMIEAYIVAAKISDEVVELKKEQCIRNYMKGYRPTKVCTWQEVKLVEYEFDSATGSIKYTIK